MVDFAFANPFKWWLHLQEFADKSGAASGPHGLRIRERLARGAILLINLAMLALLIVALGAVLLTIGPVCAGINQQIKMWWPGQRLLPWVPFVLSIGVIAGAILMTFQLQWGGRLSAASERAKELVQQWKFGLSSTLMLIGGIYIGSTMHEFLNEKADSTRSYLLCYSANDQVQQTKCLVEHPAHPNAKAWRAALQRRAKELFVQADEAYTLAASPDGGYSTATFKRAAGLYEAAFKNPYGASPDPATDQARLNALKFGPEAFRECDDCPLMRVILPLEGLPYAIGVYEVSVAEWGACSTCQSVDARKDRTSSSPLTNVRGQDIDDYESFVTKRAGATYRLPTRFEWIVAAEGGKGKNFGLPLSAEAARRDICPFFNLLNGDALPRQAAPPNGNSQCDDHFPPGELAPSVPTSATRGEIGFFRANPRGLFHTVGNASEWTRERCTIEQRGDEVAGRLVIGGDANTPPTFDVNALTISSTCALMTYGALSRGFRLVREMETGPITPRS